MRLFSFFTILLVFSACTTGPKNRTLSSVSVPYCGCLIFIDDVKNEEDLNYALSFEPDFLLRSWYRWGEPGDNKSYSQRTEVIKVAANRKVGIGGGTSLSFVNERDFASTEFDQAWLSANLDGTVTERKDRKFASLTSPGFRKYLVGKLLEQAKTGVLEIHLGESNGEIHFDDWTLGLKGDSGFLQWLDKKYSTQSLKWWIDSFGELGRSIYEKRAIKRQDFLKLSPAQKENFEREFGKSGSWEGKNALGQPAFLNELYTQNLQNFLNELRTELDRNGYRDVVIDVWGFADWMPKMSIQPNAYISTPPDESWKLNWSTNLNFDLNKNRERIKKIMQEQITSVKPIPVIYMIDHSKPFEDFKKLSDDRQANITEFFSDITKEIGANFVFRSYSLERNLLGPKTDLVIKRQCRQRKLYFCPVSQ